MPVVSIRTERFRWRVQPRDFVGLHAFAISYRFEACPDPGVTGDDIEAAIDVEWASAAAPSAKVELASCADTTTVFGGLIAIQNLLNQPRVPSIISMSYGQCEVLNGAAVNAAYKDAYQQGVLEGVSIFVSAGDEGAASCDAGSSTAVSGVTVSGLASTVYNVAVGGTDFGDLYESLEGGPPQSTYWNSTNGPTFGSAKYSLTFSLSPTWWMCSGFFLAIFPQLTTRVVPQSVSTICS